MGEDTDNDPLRYDHWVEEALRAVIRRALAYTAEFGLPGDHHFYVTFRTDAPNVILPGYLRAQHPQDMTIVLQNQFWDLEVTGDGFSISLRFKGRLERLFIPFEAVTAFADPHVNFGLQLQMIEFPGEGDDAARESVDEDEAEDAPEETPKGEVVALDAFRKK